jgi:hypothetical protein
MDLDFATSLMNFAAAMLVLAPVAFGVFKKCSGVSEYDTSFDNWI